MWVAASSVLKRWHCWKKSNLGSFPVIAKTNLPSPRERPKKEAGFSRWVGGKFRNSKGHLHGSLVLGGSEVNGSLHCPPNLVCERP